MVNRRPIAEVAAPPQPLRRERARLAVAVVAWATALIGGWAAMSRYDMTGETPAADGLGAPWPAEAHLPRERGAQLVVFLHPLCPCSQATVARLEALLASPAAATFPPPHVSIVAVVPSTPAAAWTDAPLVERARRLPGAQLWVDRGGREAARFGAQSSGAVMLYDDVGRRRFSGGVTIARGHDGESAAEGALRRLLQGEAPGPVCTYPVFGCRLVAEQSASRPGTATPHRQTLPPLALAAAAAATTVESTAASATRRSSLRSRAAHQELP